MPWPAHRIPHFYNDGRGESVAYLRQLGALDESDPEAEGMPQVLSMGQISLKKQKQKR